MSYAEFIAKKSQLDSSDGFEPVFMPDALFDFQAALVELSLRRGRLALFEDCGLGKGQPPGSKVLTIDGWKEIQCLVVGDMVIGSDGMPWPVTGIYPKQEQPTYRIHFSDGASFVVDEDHLHIVRTNNDRQRKRPWRVLDTRTLISAKLRYGSDKKSRNYDIPVVAPISFKGSQLPLDPYVLGVLLGDGGLTTKSRVTFTCAEPELLDTVRQRLARVGAHLTQKANPIDYSIGGGRGNKPNSALAALKQLGLMGRGSATKFIPQVYLYSTIEDRLDLLRGMMDTDGYIKESCQHYTVSRKMHEDVLFLIRSLGGCPTSSVKNTQYRDNDGTLHKGKPCFVATFSLKTFCPFLLSRKAAKWNPSPRDNGRWIDRITFEGTQKTVCISVASPDHSYVTEHFIVTHNTIQQLVWAENVVRKTNRPVLILTPVSVASQTIREAEKFGMEAKRAVAGSDEPVIRVTNYEKLHHFSPDEYGGMVCDESSILKSFDGATKTKITDFMRKLPYRLLCTATAAPNDYIELGTSSEALGYLGFMDMLNRFFKNARNNSATGGAYGKHGTSSQWRFRGHAEKPFWRWVCSWARSIRRPSDLGFDDGRFKLPPLNEREHIVKAVRPREGFLFSMPAVGLAEEREERRRTLQERCEMVAALVNKSGEPFVSWCHLNDEGDILEKLIPDAVQVSGKDSDESKEEKFDAFALGKVRGLITKPVIGAWGLNWQHCAHMTSFASHSFEQYYQSVRRFWRFGQTRPVVVDHVISDGEQRVLENLQRKSEQADRLFSELTRHMQDELAIVRGRTFTVAEEIPAWI